MLGQVDNACTKVINYSIRVDRKFPKLVSYIEFLLSENKMAEQAAQRPVSDSHLGGTP